jgi:hypothetical protein
VASNVELFLRTYGPHLTSEISAYLVATLKIKPDAARQQVLRAKLPIRKLGYIVFPHRARFAYLEQDFGSPRYWQALENALLATNSAYGLAIAAIRERGGLMPVDHFKIACGSPLKQLKHLSPDTVFTRMNEAGLLNKTMVSGLGECITLTQSEDYFQDSVPLVRARLITEALLLTAVKDWIRKLNIGSYESVVMRDGPNLPTVGPFAWDLSAPSYLGPLLKYSKTGEAKNGFVVCDVLLGANIDVGGIKPFIHKCRELRRLKNIGPCLQIFVADRFTAEAFAFARKNGVVPATPLHLFGTEVAEGLTALTSVLYKAALTVVDPTAFDELFKKLSKIQGATSQIRGALFEYIAAAVADKTMNGKVRMNQKFTSPDGKKAEADVVIIQDNIQVTMIECKGYSPKSRIPDSYVERWLQHNVPVCYKAAKAHPDWQNIPVHFEFWATGGLSDEALKLIETAKATIKPSKYTIELKLNADIHVACKATKDNGLIEVFEKHYMKPII